VILTGAFFNKFDQDLRHHLRINVWVHLAEDTHLLGRALLSSVRIRRSTVGIESRRESVSLAICFADALGQRRLSFGDCRSMRTVLLEHEDPVVVAEQVARVLRLALNMSAEEQAPLKPTSI
jgi:hypothetical protein